MQLCLPQGKVRRRNRGVLPSVLYRKGSLSVWVRESAIYTSLLDRWIEEQLAAGRGTHSLVQPLRLAHVMLRLVADAVVWC